MIEPNSEPKPASLRDPMTMLLSSAYAVIR
jgi:hypothetical protein